LVFGRHFGVAVLLLDDIPNTDESLWCLAALNAIRAALTTLFKTAAAEETGKTCLQAASTVLALLRRRLLLVLHSTLWWVVALLWRRTIALLAAVGLAEQLSWQISVDDAPQQVCAIRDVV